MKVTAKIMVGQFLGEIKDGLLDIYSTKYVESAAAIDHETIGSCYRLIDGMQERRVALFNADNDVEKLHDILLELEET